MSATSARAARREEHAACALGGKRVHRKVGERAPDIEPVTLPSGHAVIPEVKSRLRLPLLVTRALQQAGAYVPRPAIPLAVIFEKGARDGIACVALSDFAALAGLDVDTLPAERKPPRPRRRKAEPSQLGLPFEVAA